MTNTHDAEPAHRSSATARVLDGLELYGYQPSGGESDPRPLPEPDFAAGAVSDLFDILAGALRDTALEPDLDELLWHLTDLFHKRPPAFNVSSTTMRTASAKASTDRTAPKCARSNSNALSPRARP